MIISKPSRGRGRTPVRHRVAQAVLTAASVVMTLLIAGRALAVEAPAPAVAWGTNDITITAEVGTSLDDETIELRRIAAIRDGLPSADGDDAVALAARAAGGRGDDPVTDLFDRIIHGRAFTDKAAEALSGVLAGREPVATRTGPGTMRVTDGWYLASTRGMGASALVAAGRFAAGNAMAMTVGQASLRGHATQGDKEKPVGGAMRAPAARAAGVDRIHYSKEYPFGTNLTRDFRWQRADGSTRPAWCGNPVQDPPASGSAVDVMQIHSAQLRSVFYYGYGGPVSVLDHLSEANRTIAQHLLLGAYWEGRDPRANNYRVDPFSIPGYELLLDTVEKHPVGDDVAMNLYTLNATLQWQTLLSFEYLGNTLGLATQAKGTFALAGGTQRVTDSITVTSRTRTWSSASPGEKRATATVTLKHRPGENEGSISSATKTMKLTIPRATEKANRSGTHTSPAFAPSDFGWKVWPGGVYWFDVSLARYDDGRFVAKATDHWGSPTSGHFSSEGWKAAKSVSVVPTLSSRADQGFSGSWDQSEITTSGVFNPGKDGLLVEGGSQRLTDRVRLELTASDGRRDWDINGDGRFDDRLRLSVRTTMHMAGKSVSKVIDFASYRSSAHAAGGEETFAFVPADFGWKVWPAGDFWFTSRVDGVKGASVAAGLACSSGDPALVGRSGDALICLKDWQRDTSAKVAAENGTIAPRVQPDLDSQVAQRERTDGRLPADTVTVRLDKRVSGLNVTARAEVYWTPGTSDKDRKLIGTTSPLRFSADSFKDGVAQARYDPDRDEAMKGVQGRIGTGWTTYVWRIDKADLLGQTLTYAWNWHGGGKPLLQRMNYPSDTLLVGMPDRVSDGWQPDSEQSEQLAEWQTSVNKIAYVGGSSEGVWRDQHPAAGAVLELRETTDATGKADAPGSKAVTITLNEQGNADLPRQTICAGQTRYYRLRETSAPEPFQIPRGNAFWMLTVRNETGARGVRLTVSGTSKETGWLIREPAKGVADERVSPGSGLAADPSQWSLRLGDTVQANVMIPHTGSDRDLITPLAVAFALAAFALGLIATARLVWRQGRRKS